MKSRAAWLSLVVAFGLGFVMVRAQDQGQAYQPGPGIVNPVLTRKVEPKYTSAALRARIQGTVEVEAVVRPDGSVSDVRVVRSLDTTFGLDAQAIEAARQWVFKPGTREGKPVPVIVRIVLEFRVHGGPNGDTPSPIQSDDEFLKGAYRPGPGVTDPKVVKRVEAKYTSEAIRQKIQGQVVVEAVIGADGTVSRARVQKSLDAVYGLDEQAVIAARQWTFDAGTVQGNAVPVVVIFTLDFRLH